MQYGRALDSLIREVFIDDLALELVHVLKTDVCDGFYCIGLGLMDIPKIRLVFSSEGEDDELK